MAYRGIHGDKRYNKTLGTIHSWSLYGLYGKKETDTLLKICSDLLIELQILGSKHYDFW